MADEFQESDIIFSDGDYHSPDQNQVPPLIPFPYPEMAKRKTMTSSVPVDIPNGAFQSLDSDFEEDFNDGEMVPPHIIVERRTAGELTFSVCTGNGWTLKVRNEILRMTGFLES